MNKARQFDIIRQLDVVANIDPSDEVMFRTQALAEYLITSKCNAYVLGISGGIDSTTSGLLAQRAVNFLRRRELHADARFIAVRLPYGVQKDEDDAQRALDVIQPDDVITIDIKPAVDAMMAQIVDAGIVGDDPAQLDFVKGNVKARQRMIAQYAIAGATNGLVIGTDHAAEALMGFFTKFGDGACDITPLAGLSKRQVRAVGALLGAPEHLVNKTPTADLEDLDPGKPDEVAYGVTYDEIDDYLEGLDIDEASEAKIVVQWEKTMHKRALPVSVIE